MRLVGLDSPELSADICVIGAGAAGFTLAHALRNSGLSVLVVESGPMRDPTALDLGEVVGLPYNGLLHGRVRGLGGTTRVWPGQCMRLRPEEYAAWPFEADELNRWYELAEELLGLVPGETARHTWELFDERGPGFDETRVSYATSIFARRKDLSRLDVGETRILTGATVTRVEAGTAFARDLDGGTVRIDAERLVVCAGALETTRLLLASGVENDALGRFFQDHAVCHPAQVVGARSRSLQNEYGARFRGGRRYYPKLLLAPEVQRARTVRGCMANVVFDYGENSAWEAALRLHRSLRARRLGAPRDLGKVLFRAPQLLAAVARRAGGREPTPRPAATRILAIVEQPPRAESRLTLSDHLDPLGVPRIRVDWVLGEEERAAIRTLVEILDEEFRRTGAGAVEAEPWLDDRDAWRTHVFDSFHPAGTARMATGTDGVVDADCRVLGGPELYVCGSVVFPASGCTNPTLTIVALALRLADHLRRG